MKKFTFLSAILLSLGLYIAFGAISAYATPVVPAGTGTLDNPYKITVTENLEWMSSEVSKGNTFVGNYFKLINNVDTAGKLFNPIGSSSFNFFGIFDGQGYSIKKLKIYKPSLTNVGLFGYTGEGSEIKNLLLEEVNITGDGNIGALVGSSYSKIDNCNVISGTVSGVYQGGNIGGLVGIAHRAITNSKSGATIKGGSNDVRVGGLVGMAAGQSDKVALISNSSATGDVSGYWMVGGLVGENAMWGEIANSNSSGSVTGTRDFIGSLVGRSVNGQVVNSSATGVITGGVQNIPGLIGFSTDYIDNTSYVRSSSEYLYTTQNDTATIKGYVGGSADIVIPSSLDSYQVTAFEDQAVNNPVLSSITFEDKTLSFISTGESIENIVTIKGYVQSTSEDFASTNSLQFIALASQVNGSDGGGTTGDGQTDSGNEPAIPPSVGLDTQIDIIGEINATIIEVVVPLNISFIINPNDINNSFVSVPFVMQNNTTSPISIEFLGFTSQAGTTAKVVNPNSRTKDEFSKLSKNKTEKEIAIGIREGALPTIWSPSEVDGQVPNTKVGEIRIERLSSKIINIDSFHGNSWGDNKQLEYLMHIRISLAN